MRKLEGRKSHRSVKYNVTSVCINYTQDYTGSGIKYTHPLFASDNVEPAMHKTRLLYAPTISYSIFSDVNLKNNKNNS